MKRSLPWILLALSLLVNAGFLFGAWQAQQHAGRLMQQSAMKAEDAVTQLELNSVQRQSLEETRKALAAQRRAGQDDPERKKRRREVLEALLQPDYNRQKIRDLLAEDREGRMERWLDMNKEIHRFLQRLDSEQQQSFLARAMSQRGWIHALLFPQLSGADD